MNPTENFENSNNNKEEITIKIRTMDKEFEIQIKKTSTIKQLKEKIEQVTIFFFLNIFY
jgi:hypothetical protein